MDINDLRDQLFTELATSLQMALSRRNDATVVANTDKDPALQAQIVALMIEHGVTALVIAPAYRAQETTFGLLLRAAVPVKHVLRQVVHGSKAF